MTRPHEGTRRTRFWAAIGASVLFVVSFVGCGGKSLASADDAIRSLDDIFRAADNVADDFTGVGFSSTDELARYVAQASDPAAQMRSRVQLAAAELRVVEPAASEPILEDVSCTVADFYIAYGEWPDVSLVEAYVDDRYQMESPVIASKALEIAGGQADSSVSLRDFATVFATYCDIVDAAF